MCYIVVQVSNKMNSSNNHYTVAAEAEENRICMSMVNKIFIYNLYVSHKNSIIVLIQNNLKHPFIKSEKEHERSVKALFSKFGSVFFPLIKIGCKLF